MWYLSCLDPPTGIAYSLYQNTSLSTQTILLQQVWNKEEIRLIGGGRDHSN